MIGFLFYFYLHCRMLAINRYKRLMFGVNCAPEIFQKTMETVLAGLEGVIVYLDDVVVFGSTREEHDRRVETLFDRMREYGILLNDRKCIFGAEEIEFLGHVLNEQGVRPTESRIAAVKHFREPKTIAELRSFLGLITYVGRFIPNHASRTEPLRRLLQAGVSFHWKEEQQEAFKTIKLAICETKFLGFFDRKDKTKLIVDASPEGLGAVLVQENTEGQNRIISFASKSLTDLEKKYFQTEREALAIVWGVEKFKLYLLGHKFELITDCKALKFLFTPRSRPCPRIERWVLRIQSYNYDIKYEPGITNLADALSRLSISKAQYFDQPADQYVNQLLEHAIPKAVIFMKVIEATKQDEVLQELMDALLADTWTDRLKDFKHFKAELHHVNGALMRGDRLVIPESLQHQVLQCAHDGHPGMSLMKRRLRQKVWWPKMDNMVEKFVKRCGACTLVSAVGPPEPMLRTKMPEKPWTDVAIDFLGPLPSGHYLLVLVDYFSRFTEVIVMKQITAELTVNALFETFSRFGIPETMRSDNGPQFISEPFKVFCEEYGITHQKTTPYWPQANGEVERMNSTILKRLRISQEEKCKHWKWDLRSFLLMYNSTPHSITGIAPSALMFGRVLRDKLSSLQFPAGIVSEDVRDRDWEKKLEAAEESNTQRHAKKSDLKEGDTVVAKRIVKDNKLSTNYGSELFDILSREGAEAKIRSKESGKVYHRNVGHLKRFVEECQAEKHDNIEADVRVGEATEAVRRSRRDMKTSQYLKNYITNVNGNNRFED